MKKLILIILAIIVSYNSFSQKNINLIIVIDDIVSTKMFDLHFSFVKADGTEKIVKGTYTPGNLEIKQEDFDSIFDSNTTTVFWSFDYSENLNTKTKYYSYKIKLSREFLKGYFFILYVYNKNKLKFSKKFQSKENTNYTYEYDSPSGSMRQKN